MKEVRSQCYGLSEKVKNRQDDKTKFSVAVSGFLCAVEKGLDSRSWAKAMQWQLQMVPTKNGVLAIVGISLLGGLELVELEHVIDEFLLARGRCACWV